MLQPGKCRSKVSAMVVSLLFTLSFTHADESKMAAAPSESVPKEALDEVNLGSVTVLGEFTNLVGITDGISQGEIGKSQLNQAQLDVIQASNMGAVLDKIPGVSMSGSPRPGGQNINIWGMSESRNVPITIDGALKTFDKYRQGSLYVDPDLVKQVTVNKGAFSADVGNGGFGGNVQLETKDAQDFLKPDQNIGAYLKYGFHTNNEQKNYTGAVFGQSKNGMVDGLIYFSRADSRDVELADKQKYRGSALDQNSYLIKSNIYFSQESQLTLSHANTHFKGWMPFAAMGGNTITSDPNNEYDWKRRIFYRDQKDQSYSAKFEYLPADNPWVNLKMDAAYSQTKQHDQKVAPKEGEKAPSILLSTFGKENWTTYKNSSLHLRNTSHFTTAWAEHHVTVGVQYLRKQQDALMFYDSGKYGSEEFNHGYFTPPMLPAGRQTVLSAYVNDEIKIGNFTVTPSLRYDHVKNRSFGNVEGYHSTDPVDGHDYRPVSYSGLSPRLALYWQPSESLALFADYTRSWQSPTLHDQYIVQAKGISGPNGTSRGLGKEKLSAFRLGGLMNLQNILMEDDLLALSATYFNNKVKDEVIRKIGAIYCESHHLSGDSKSCGKPMSSYHNGPGYTIQGLELSAKYDSEYLFGGLSATVIKGKRIGSPRNIWSEKDSWMRDIPPRELRATIGFNLPSHHFSMGWESAFVRKQDRTPLVTDPKAGALSYPLTAGYSVHSLFMTYSPDGLYGPKIHLMIDNIFNKQYAPYLSERVEAPGRDIRLSISYQF